MTKHLNHFRYMLEYICSKLGFHNHLHVLRQSIDVFKDLGNIEQYAHVKINIHLLHELLKNMADFLRLSACLYAW